MSGEQSSPRHISFDWPNPEIPFFQIFGIRTYVNTFTIGPAPVLIKLSQ